MKNKLAAIIVACAMIMALPQTGWAENQSKPAASKKEQAKKKKTDKKKARKKSGQKPAPAPAKKPASKPATAAPTPTPQTQSPSATTRNGGGLDQNAGPEQSIAPAPPSRPAEVIEMDETALPGEGKYTPPTAETSRLPAPPVDTEPEPLDDDMPYYYALRYGPGWTTKINYSVNSANGKLTLTNDYEFAMALGVRTLKILRFEMEGGFAKTRVTNAGDNITTSLGITADGLDENYNFMLNAYLELPNSTMFVPFVGAGTGWLAVRQNLTVALYDVRVGRADRSYQTTATQFMAGVEFRPLPRLSFELMFHYISVKDIGIWDIGQLNSEWYLNGYKSSFIKGGVRINF